jgi:hypothetical protein
MKLRRRGLALTLVRDLRDHRAPVSGEDLADFETDVLAGFVLARASAGLADSTIRNDTGLLARELQMVVRERRLRHSWWPGFGRYAAFGSACAR